MNLKKISVFTLILLGNLFIQTSHAEAELFGAPSETTSAAPAENISTPARDMTMDTVIKNFGEPVTRLEPVGKPPITRWIYNNYTVYFENNRVLHSVTNR